MRAIKVLVGALGLLACAIPALAAVELFHERIPGPRPELLVVGSGHFANPGRDAVNIKVDDVLGSKRQAEVAELVKRLAAFRPTIVAVEWPASRQDQLDTLYNNYRAGRYKLSRREQEQLGLRLAARLKLEQVNAVDWNGKPPGAESDYAFDDYAKAHGQTGLLAAISDPRRSPVPQLGSQTLVEWLLRLNDPKTLLATQQIYLDIARIGQGDDWPGAAWVGTWYARNLRIFHNILALAHNPNDRVLVIFGAGHAYLLGQIARESGAFRVQQAGEYLK